jgi:hypothetical protein
MRCEHCLRPVTVQGGCSKHPGAGILDLRHPEDADYAVSVSTVRSGGRGRRWTTVGWLGVAALMGGFLMMVDPFGAFPVWLEDAGLMGMVGAATAMALSLGAHTLGAIRDAPAALQARRHRARERRDALDDPALHESTRDLDRARMLRATALGGFAVLYVLIAGHIGSLDVGHHDLRGLEGMPTTGLLAALTALGGASIVAIPVALLGRRLLAALGRGPEQESMDATGLVDEDWDFDTLEFDLDEPPGGDHAPAGATAAGSGAHPRRTPAHAPPHSGRE